VDGFNPAKVQVLGRAYDGTLDAVDIPPLWNWRPRDGFGLHWDGLNNSLREVFLNSGIGNGASSDTIEIDGLDRLRNWVADLQPPSYPFAIDAALADRGKPIFDRRCADCHSFGGAKVGETIPIDLLRTDRHRLDAWTPAALAGFSGLDAYSWRYTHFRKTDGYVAAPLDGIWARAPYLHNGSVPTLRDLLAPADRRPQRFVRGYDVYDQRNVGFVSAGADAEAEGRLYDTSLPGNGCQGHEYGTDLTSADVDALLEYMKTL
jgi:cytochrome c5